MNDMILVVSLPYTLHPLIFQKLLDYPGGFEKAYEIILGIIP